MKHKTYTVYGLIDPNTMKLTYIGVTSLDVNYRLYNHLEEAFMFQRELNWNFNRKHLWLLSLYAKNQIPYIVKLITDIIDKSEAYKLERLSIKFIKGLNNNTLINGRKKINIVRPKVKNRGLTKIFKNNAVNIKFQ